MASSRTVYVAGDCATLRDTFLSKHSTSFSSFKECWEELSFHHIFLTVSERNVSCGISLIETIYQCGSDWLVDPQVKTATPETTPTTPETTPSTDDLAKRLSGLYLIWCVFSTHIYTPKVLVRTTLSSWNRICQFHDMLRKREHHEGDYILSKLKAESAFLICCTPMPMCIPLNTFNYSKDHLVSCYRPISSKVLSPHVSSLVSQMEEYSQSKQQLSAFLPHHLLSKPTLGEKLKRLINFQE